MTEHPLLPSNRAPVWQSLDRQMETGLVSNPQPYYYASLGSRPVQLGDIQAFIHFMHQLQQPHPLVLLSQCPGFAPSTGDEAKGLVFYAGQYRALQQQQKQKGRMILSVIQKIAVGGTYLMHGLSALTRAATPDTQFHDTIPQHSAVPLHQAMERGLIHAIIPTDHLPQWLSQHLSFTQP